MKLKPYAYGSALALAVTRVAGQEARTSRHNQRRARCYLREIRINAYIKTC
jgi:hypothetical protein